MNNGDETLLYEITFRFGKSRDFNLSFSYISINANDFQNVIWLDRLPSILRGTIHSLKLI